MKDAYFHIQVVQRHRKFLRFAFGGKAYKVLPFGLALAPRTFNKSSSTEAPGDLNPHFSQFQGVGDSPQGRSPSPPLCTWPPAEWPEESASSSSAAHFWGGLSGLDLDAGLSGPCLGREHPIMLGPLQARSSRVSGPVLQAPRPHGGGFPGSSLGAASYKTVPLVDEVPGYSSLRILRESGACLHTLLVWRDPNFLRRGVEMGVVCHRQMILTDASLSGWGGRSSREGRLVVSGQASTSPGT